MSQSNLFDLSGKVSLVTGAGSGIGRVISEAMAEHGSDIVCADINEAWARETANIAEQHGVKALVVKADVSKQEEVREMIFKNLNILESQIYRGERNALKVGFRLFAIADSKMEASLVKIIGYLLRYNTKLFLEELKSHEVLVPDLDQLVCSFQLNEAGDTVQQKLEKNIRLKALGYVENKELKAMKKKCIRILKNLKLD